MCVTYRNCSKIKHLVTDVYAILYILSELLQIQKCFGRYMGCYDTFCVLRSIGSPAGFKQHMAKLLDRPK